MSSTVSVLAPNGRRQTVKCTPNSTIMQIIDEVCRKQGFPPENYDLKHHNKIVDTTLTFRFSGLPNNAQLELVDAAKTRIDSDVILAVNFENGSRIMGNFLPDETLLAILEKLCPEEVKKGDNPVVIYMRNEIYGAALKTTTLRALGLRGGRAMIRLLHRSPGELRAQANVSAPLPLKPAEEKPYHRVLKLESPLEGSVGDPPPQPKQLRAEVDFLKLAREKRKLPESPVKSVDSEPQLPKSRPRVEIQGNHEAMEVDLAPPSPEPKKTEPRMEDFVFLGERNAMLFSLESAHSVPTEDLPDDFFELTIDDAKKILGDIRRKRHDMENGVMLTSALRDFEESKKQLRNLNRYKKSVIRVQFPDRSILQGTFTPIETINDVSNFVRDYLEDKSHSFYLYTTPPKYILPVDDRLLEVGCVPGALLHLGSDHDVTLKAALRDKFTTNSVASLAASKMRRDGTREAPNEFEMEDDFSTATLNDSNTPGPSSQPTNYERKVMKSTENVPKWFKSCK